MKNPQVIFAYFLCAFGFLVSAYWFFPGYMSYDAVVQVLQAQHFQFTNTHPPMMAFVWHYLLLLTPRGFSVAMLMFLLQLLLLWIALILWVYLLAKRQCRYLWLIPLVGLFPNIIILNSFIWKDLQMGNSLFLAITLWVLLREGVCSEFFKLIAGILMVLLVFYAFCLRHEAVFACLPIFYLWGGYFCGHKKICKAALTLGFALVFGVFSFLFAKVLHTHEDYPAQQVMFYDLASLSIQENQMLIPLNDCRDSQTCFADIRSDYNPMDVLTILTDFITGIPTPVWVYQFKLSHPDVRPLQWTYSAWQYEQLKAVWFHGIMDHPGLYLYDRAQFFLRGLSYDPFFYNIKFIILSKPSLYHVAPANFVIQMFFVVYALLSMVFAFAFALWFWLGLNVVMWVFLRTKEDQYPFGAVVKVMLLSGLMLCLSHFIVAATVEFRFFYWMMLATLFSFVLLFLNKNGKLP